MPSRKRSLPSFSDWSRRPINQTPSLFLSFDFATLRYLRVRPFANLLPANVTLFSSPYSTSRRLLLVSKIKLPMSSSFSKSSRNSSTVSRISTLSTRYGSPCVRFFVQGRKPPRRIRNCHAQRDSTPARVTSREFRVQRSPFWEVYWKGVGGRGSTDPDSILRGCGNGDDVRNIAQRIRFPRDYRVAGILACEWTI